jgi:hypothetical protein
MTPPDDPYRRRAVMRPPRVGVIASPRTRSRRTGWRHDHIRVSWPERPRYRKGDQAIAPLRGGSALRRTIAIAQRRAPAAGASDDRIGARAVVQRASALATLRSLRLVGSR